jgi:tRNA (guanine37-N1)-methyltransferase
MMAGVGPFAVPLALRLKLANAPRPHSAVYANDLNPASYEYLVENTRLNNCSSHMNSLNLDGRDFIRQLDSQGVAYTDVIMNLPQNAIDFVDVFIGMLSRSPPQSPARSPPVVHVYAFSSSIDPVEDVRNRIASVLRCSSSQLLPTQIWNKRSSRAYLEANSLAHIVRDVAPNKVMVCYSFRLPRDVAEGVIEEVDGATKRRRLDDSADLGVP